MIDSHDNEDEKLTLILDLYLLTIVMMKILVRLMVIRREKNIIRPLSKSKEVKYCNMIYILYHFVYIIIVLYVWSSRKLKKSRNGDTLSPVELIV